MIDLNVRALVELTHLFWPQILAKKRGGVLNVASTAAFQPGPLFADLLRYESLRPVVHRGLMGGSARHRRACVLPVPRPHPKRLS